MQGRDHYLEIPKDSMLKLVSETNMISLMSEIPDLLHMCMLIRVCLFATPWTVARQAPLSTEFSRQECWSGLPFPSQGIFLIQGLNACLLHVSGIPGNFFFKPLSHLGIPLVLLAPWRLGVNGNTPQEDGVLMGYWSQERWGTSESSCLNSCFPLMGN